MVHSHLLESDQNQKFIIIDYENDIQLLLYITQYLPHPHKCLYEKVITFAIGTNQRYFQ